MRIALLGCSLDPRDCAPDEEIAEVSFNVIMSKTTPDVMASSKNDLLSFSFDTRHFYYLDPGHVSEENIFLSQSVLKMQTESWDSFEVMEYE